MHNLRAFYTKALLSWGFIVRYRGVSAAQPALPIPPPTTVVGAFAYPLIRALEMSSHIAIGSIDWGEGKLISEIMKPLLKATVSAAAGMASPQYERAHRGPRVGYFKVGLAVYQELGRIIGAPYKGDTEIGRIKKAKLMSSEFFTEAITRAMPVQAVGATYAPGLKVELLWIVDAEKVSRELNVSLEKLDTVAKKAVYGVVRLGSKEGLVAIEDARYIESVRVHKPGEKISTRLYVPKSCAELVSGNAGELVLPNLEYKLTTYYVPAEVVSHNILIPLYEGGLAPTFRLPEPCLAFSINSGVVSVSVRYEF